MSILFRLVSTIQQVLFPALEQELAEPLGDKQRLFVATVELARPEKLMATYESQGQGRPRQWRLPILLAFIAKAVWNQPTTRALLELLAYSPGLRRLCGWERADQVPSEATFSRAFEEFAAGGLPQRIHEALIRAQLGDKLVGHVCRDSTMIWGRERQAPKAPPRPKRRNGRPKQGQAEPLPKPRLQLQGTRTVAENLADLPTVCDVGSKLDSKGHKVTWVGYKLHVDTVDGAIPVSAVLTSASTHDSQAAIPLAQLTAGRVCSLYDVMDSAYDAAAIREFSRQLGHVPVIEFNARRGVWPPPQLEPARLRRLRERTVSERINADLKDNHGGNHVRVRGALKVLAHLSLGLLVIAAKGLVRLLE
jgi:hypothetical protein